MTKPRECVVCKAVPMAVGLLVEVLFILIRGGTDADVAYCRSKFLSACTPLIKHVRKHRDDVVDMLDIIVALVETGDFKDPKTVANLESEYALLSEWVLDEQKRSRAESKEA